MATWTLKYNGTTQSLADWGLDLPQIEYANHAPDILRLRAPRQLVDDDALFAFEQEVILYRDGVQYFVGVALRPNRLGDVSEGIEYTIAGPWYYLQNLVYMQTWETWDSGTAALVTKYTPHVFLNQATNGTRITTGAQIQAVINYAVAQLGAKMQLDATDLPLIQVPIDEARDITCAEAIEKMRRWSPGSLSWFDYSTTPPTLYIKRPADLAENSIAITDLTRFRLEPLYDRQVSEVVLKYEQVNTTDGTSRVALTEDVYPAESTGRTLRAMVATIDLQGYSASYATVQIEVDAINTGSTAWWQSKIDWLNDERIDPNSIVITGITRSGANAYANELTAGQIAPWMTVGSEADTITAYVSYTALDAAADGETTREVVQDKEISIQIIATNATSGSYSSLTSFTGGEVQPVGLAQALYEDLNRLEYAGSLMWTEEDCSQPAKMGQLVNLTGGRAEWATMKAMIQRVTEDLENGTTTVEVGPPDHLGPNDLIELLRVTRSRNVWNAPSTAVDGQVQGGGKVQLGQRTPVRTVTQGPSRKSRMNIFATPTGGRIDLNVADTNGKQLKVREIDCCMTDENGSPVQGKILVVASEPYTP